MPKRRIIRASEIGQYAYCARAWWLGNVMGVRPSNAQDLARGTVAHAQHGQRLALAGMMRWVALALFVLAVILFVTSQ
ncbi:MAG: hypothetical protein KIH69_014610 [Anaerolineae bacterium]|nr:hypothetical protein [Anaerolineae bacterium]